MNKEFNATWGNAPVMLTGLAAVVGFLLLNGNIKLTKETQAAPQEVAVELPVTLPAITEQQLDVKLSALRDELQRSIDATMQSDTGQSQDAIVTAVSETRAAMQAELRSQLNAQGDALRSQLDAQGAEIAKVQGAITALSKQQTSAVTTLAATSKSTSGKQAAAESNDGTTVRYYYTEAPASYTVYRNVPSQPATVTYRYYSSTPVNSVQYQMANECENGVCTPQYSRQQFTSPQYAMPRYSTPMRFQSAGNCNNGMCSQ